MFPLPRQVITMTMSKKNAFAETDGTGKRSLEGAGVGPQADHSQLTEHRAASDDTIEGEALGATSTPASTVESDKKKDFASEEAAGMEKQGRTEEVSTRQEASIPASATAVLERSRHRPGHTASALEKVMSAKNAFSETTVAEEVVNNEKESPPTNIPSPHSSTLALSGIKPLGSD